MGAKYTKAQAEATARYLQNFEDFKVRVLKGEKDKIKKFAAQNGESLTVYVTRLINEDMKGAITMSRVDRKIKKYEGMQEKVGEPMASGLVEDVKALKRTLYLLEAEQETYDSQRAHSEDRKIKKLIKKYEGMQEKVGEPMVSGLVEDVKALKRTLYLLEAEQETYDSQRAHSEVTLEMENE